MSSLSLLYPLHSTASHRSVSISASRAPHSAILSQFPYGPWRNACRQHCHDHTIITLPLLPIPYRHTHIQQSKDIQSPVQYSQGVPSRRSFVVPLSVPVTLYSHGSHILKSEIEIPCGSSSLFCTQNVSSRVLPISI